MAVKTIIIIIIIIIIRTISIVTTLTILIKLKKIPGIFFLKAYKFCILEFINDNRAIKIYFSFCHYYIFSHPSH